MTFPDFRMSNRRPTKTFPDFPTTDRRPTMSSPDFPRTNSRSGIAPRHFCRTRPHASMIICELSRCHRLSFVSSFMFQSTLTPTHVCARMFSGSLMSIGGSIPSKLYIQLLKKRKRSYKEQRCTLPDQSENKV